MSRLHIHILIFLILFKIYYIFKHLESYYIIFLNEKKNFIYKYNHNTYLLIIIIIIYLIFSQLNLNKTIG